jgi:hypothetical protein
VLKQQAAAKAGAADGKDADPEAAAAAEAAALEARAAMVCSLTNRDACISCGS